MATQGDVRILPGVADVNADAPDVMRGEETQLLGVTEPDFHRVGLHSRHPQQVDQDRSRQRRFVFDLYDRRIVLGAFQSTASCNMPLNGTRAL